MYQRKTRGWSQHLDFMVLDIIALEVSLILACILRIKIEDLLTRRMFWGLLIILPFIDLAVMVITDVYHGVIRCPP